MRLVRTGRAVWDVLVIADDEGYGFWDWLRKAARSGSDSGAAQMYATLRTEVPLNGPSRNKTKCRPLGDEIFEFKEPRVRVLWFYDVGARRRIICTHYSPKIHKKEFQKEIAKAIRIRSEYLTAKAAAPLMELGPEE